MTEKEKASRMIDEMEGWDSVTVINTLQAYIPDAVLANLYDTLVHENVIFPNGDPAMTTPKLTPKRRCKNDVVQFEVRSFYGKDLKSEYDWCVANLPLKEERGLVYQVKEFYIITRSQRIIDKVNRHFGSSFSFKNWQESRIFYID